MEKTGHGDPERGSDEGSVEAARPLDPSVLLRPTHAANAFEETVQRLLQTVRLGVMAPGEKLPAERELAVMLGVSRDTLREAIGALSDAGYLVSRRGRYGGTFVAEGFAGATPVMDSDGELHPRDSVPRAEVDDALRLRRAVETGAAKQAAERPLAPSQVLRLRQALLECSEASAQDYRRLDARLHLLVAELSGSPSLVRLGAEVRMRVNELLDRIPLIGANIEHSNEQHAALVGAIVDGDPELAGRLMEEHVAGSEALLRGFLG